MKKHSIFLITSAVIISLVAFISGCANEPTVAEQPASSLEGRYVGYSWRGEAGGGTFEEANQYIETILELDENGIIEDAKMRFFVQQDGYWTTRQSGNASVSVDFSVEPTPAIPGDDYQPGDSMFNVYTTDMMSFYAVAANNDGTAAVALVDPVTRYQFEMKFPSDFDFDMPFGDLTIGSGMIVPTIRTSGSGILKPDNWDSLADKNLLNIDIWSHVVNDKGVLQNITESSSVGDFLEALGVEFDGGQPQPLPAQYGYFGLGGWKGNFDAIEQALIGQNATQKTSLVDWSNPRFEGSINEANQFGVDVETGATRTVQDSLDGISGATVRISRESASYQRALVNAGIISESDVVIGRF